MTDPTWAGRAARKPQPETGQEPRTWLPALALVASVAMVGAGGYVLIDDSGTDIATAGPSTTAPHLTSETTAEQTTAEQTAPATEAAATDTSTETTAAQPTTTDGGTTETTADPTGGSSADPTTDTSADPTTDTSLTDTSPQVVIDEGETRGAVLRDGVLYLGGAVPSREVADQIIERAAAVVGADNVIDEYVIDPDAVLAAGAPLYVDDVVLFAYGERTYDPQFEPLLDLGLALLLQNPSVTVTIVTHTDASGSASYNDRLSYQRGESVAQYWVDRGVPVDQIRIDARGEHDPRADNDTAAGAQLNRRAEFYIEGLLG